MNVRVCTTEGLPARSVAFDVKTWVPLSRPVRVSLPVVPGPADVHGVKLAPSYAHWKVEVSLAEKSNVTELVVTVPPLGDPR